MYCGILWLVVVWAINCHGSEMFLQAVTKSTQKNHAKCLMQIIDNNFYPFGAQHMISIVSPKSLPSPAFEVRDYITKQLNKRQKWPIEVTDGRRVNFKIAKQCKNCPVGKGEKPSYRYNYQIEYRTKHFLIIFDTLQNYQVHFEILVTLKTFYLEAVYLVYLSNPMRNHREIARQVFYTLYSHNIFYALVVVTRMDNALVVYNLDFFYETKICCRTPQVNLLDTCTFGETKSNAFLNSTFPVKPNLRNCSMDVISVKYPPYIIDENNGFEIRILKLLEDTFNLTFNLKIDVNGSGWGQKKNGIWSGKLGTIKREKIMGIGNIAINSEMEIDFSYSRDYYYQLMKWIVPIAETMPRWKVIFIIFDFNLWLVCLVMIFVSALLFYVFSKGQATNTDVNLKSFGYGLFVSLGLFLGTVISKQPTTYIMRSIFLSVTFFSLIASNYYQTKLITYLTLDRFEYQISTSEGISESNMQIGGIQQFKNIFESNYSSLYTKLLSRFVVLSNEEDTITNWLKIVGQRRDTVTVAGQLYTKYLIAINSSDTCYSNGKPKIYVSTQTIHSYPIRLLMSNNHVLIKPFDAVIGRLMTHGFINMWVKGYLTALEKSEFLSRYDAEKSGEDVQFTVEHVEGAFVILGGGYALAIFFFFCELFWQQFRKYWKQRSKKIVSNAKGNYAKLYYNQNESQRRVFMYKD